MAEEKKLNPETASVDSVTVELLKKAQAERYRNHIRPQPDHERPAPSAPKAPAVRFAPRAPAGCPNLRRWAKRPKSRMGLRGATAETISARNFARMVAAGTASHNDHSRGVALLFKEVAHGKARGLSD